MQNQLIELEFWTSKHTEISWMILRLSLLSQIEVPKLQIGRYSNVGKG